VATGLGKPEKYVMVTIAPMQPMVFAGSDAPCAYLELKSIGLPTNKTKDLSAALCQLVHDSTGIKADRIYIEFFDAPREMWGWNEGTF
jgi:phenylpyruvate tautomerase PptA (4-oxalocrotonate tautomerase family)